MSDDALLGELAAGLSRHRLNRNETQASVAREAGVARRTVSKIENGHVVDTRSLVRVLRALELLDGLEALVPRPLVSPVALAESQGRVRRRASGRPESRPGQAESSEASDIAGEWSWPDEER